MYQQRSPRNTESLSGLGAAWQPTHVTQRLQEDTPTAHLPAYNPVTPAPIFPSYDSTELPADHPAVLRVNAGGAFQRFLHAENLDFHSAAQMCGVHPHTIYRIHSGLPVSPESAQKVREGLRERGRFYDGPIMVLGGAITGQQKPVADEEKPLPRRHRVLVGDRVAYDGNDPYAASQIMIHAAQTFADYIQVLVDEPVQATRTAQLI